MLDACHPLTKSFSLLVYFWEFLGLKHQTKAITKTFFERSFDCFFLLISYLIIPPLQIYEKNISLLFMESELMIFFWIQAQARQLYPISLTFRSNLALSQSLIILIVWTKQKRIFLLKIPKHLFFWLTKFKILSIHNYYIYTITISMKSLQSVNLIFNVTTSLKLINFFLLQFQMYSAILFRCWIWLFLRMILA